MIGGFLFCFKAEGFQGSHAAETVSGIAENKQNIGDNKQNK